MNYAEKWNKGIDFNTYKELVAQLVKDKKTSGPEQTEKLIGYTKLNHSRMRKWDKLYKPSEEIRSLANENNSREKWLVITEAWCGDAAQITPVFHKISELLSGVEMRLVFRDENLDLMDKHLTNGGRSIPKVLKLDENNQLIGEWGPRPKALQDLVMDWKNVQGLSHDVWAEKMHQWYNDNKGVEIENEIKDWVFDPVLA